MGRPRLAVLISGNGSNLQAIIDATKSGALEATVDLVLSNRKNAYGLERAKQAGIKTATISLKSFKDAGKTRLDFDVAVAELIKQEFEPDLIVLAGWMHILSPNFLNVFPGCVINLHPALPGQFDGAGAIDRAFEAYQRGEIKHTGIMVHKVIPEVDRGEVLLTQDVEILPTDTLQDLEQRIHAQEHVLLVDGIRKFLGLSPSNPKQ